MPPSNFASTNQHVLRIVLCCVCCTALHPTATITSHPSSSTQYPATPFLGPGLALALPCLSLPCIPSGNRLRSARLGIKSGLLKPGRARQGTRQRPFFLSLCCPVQQQGVVRAATNSAPSNSQPASLTHSRTRTHTHHPSCGGPQGTQVQRVCIQSCVALMVLVSVSGHTDERCVR